MTKVITNSQGKVYTANGKALISPALNPVITSLNITPTTSAQTITAPSGTDGYSPVNVAAVTAAIDANITAANIVSGISILGVNGSATVLNGETRTATLTSSAGNTFTPTSGKNAITSITVTPNNEARSVTPSTSAQTLNVNSGYSGNGTISVAAVTASIDANITAGNIKKDVTILNVTGTYEGSGGGEFQLTRIKDDTNTEIGTHFTDFTDGNGQKYKVVCLDAQYRSSSDSMVSATDYSAVTNLPEYRTAIVLCAKETAAFNTQKIIDWCTSNNYTSYACNHCRSISFVINSTTYYGQVPNFPELVEMIKNYNELNTLDISPSSYDNLKFDNFPVIWSSNQTQHFMWGSYGYTGLLGINRTLTTIKTFPVLEIPY